MPIPLIHAIDFGTSNSLLAVAKESGEISLAPLEIGGSPMLRSLLYTPEKGQWFLGEEAVTQYRELGGEGRFFKSIKKFLPEDNYNGTIVHDRKIKLEELIAVFLRSMRTRANAWTGCDTTDVILGRPALYSLDGKLDKLAEERMRMAATMAGYKNISFCPEPLAAGLDLKNENAQTRLVLVCDFGGGTSDFTLLRLHGEQFSEKDVLGLSGIFVAGDAFDGAIMQESIAQHFGKDITYKLPMSQNIINFPRGLLKKLCSPAHITHLKERDTWELLKEIRHWALSGEEQRKIDQLFSLVEMQLGWPLFHAIEQAKISLAQESTIHFMFKQDCINIEQPITRSEFKTFAAPLLDQIIETMMDVFKQSGLRPDQVDEICLTGGTAQSPLIRERLALVFGEHKLREHKVYQSVVLGLGQYAVLKQRAAI